MDLDVKKVLRDEQLFDITHSTYANDATLIINRTIGILIHNNE